MRRKCVGDQFALMEAVVALALALQRYEFRMVPGFDPGMTTGEPSSSQGCCCTAGLTLHRHCLRHWAPACVQMS